MLDPVRLAALLLAYLLGSIPWGLVLVKLLKGIDLRTVGSGNIGATNAMRAAGKPIGLAVFALDFLKGWAAVALCAGALAGESAQSPTAIVCGAASVAGHCFPVWLRFVGGKGVATGCGALVAIDPLIWVLGGLVWAATLAISRYVGLASVAMGVAFPIAAWWRTGQDGLAPTVGAALLSLLILVRHRSNMRRMWNGQEPKAFAKRAAAKEPRG
jgi:glycerol-3-phosphate acyltransferase PlsY